MKIGDLDGKGKFYDEGGCVIIEEGEEVIDEFTGNLRSWIGVYPLGPEQFKYVEMEMNIVGVFTTTSKRLLFVGMPVSSKGGFYGGGGMDSMHPNYQYVKGLELRVNQNDGRLYFSIPIPKVKAITPEASNPEIIADHQGTEVGFDVAKETAERLLAIFEKLEPKK
jgi:hypothetical protein